MNVTLGGDRLGSGQKEDLELHNYYRSTHNLSEKFTSTMGVGMLIPFMCKLAMRGDNFEIDLEAAARTIPTKAPLFGSFKMQIDVFQCPIRLYQGLLHNNPTALGLKMSQVKFPTMTIQDKRDRENAGEFAGNALVKYLGLSGIGRPSTALIGDFFYRKFNAIPVLAYYDIFKNYYSNKQEEKGYVIQGQTTSTTWDNALTYLAAEDNDATSIEIDNPQYYTEPDGNRYNSESFYWANSESALHVTLRIRDYDEKRTLIKTRLFPLTTIEKAKTGLIGNYTTSTYSEGITQIEFDIASPLSNGEVKIETMQLKVTSNDGIRIQEFDLSNIDDMRMALLSHHTLGSAYNIGSLNKLPYNLIMGRSESVTLNAYPLNGICLKTYQSDIFNNWINTEWLDGENGINAVTKIAVTDGAISIDSMLLAEKLYNMLNRVAVSGATYEDWQDVVYEDSPRRHIESPIYIGGMSSEVVFEEIIQNAPTTEAPLGTLGGRGVLVKRKGGNISVKIDEASFIIGIVSLTPRIYYTQGNEFYMTDIMSMDDIHKPALDGIGFQNLIGERMAWFDTLLNNSGSAVPPTITRSTIGKIPAWLEYMTSVDKAYGDFTKIEKAGFMILNRNYEQDETTGGIKDATTYVDPQKYNYAFADARLQSQNFWVQIDSKIIARRLMSAKQIPNI